MCDLSSTGVAVGVAMGLSLMNKPATVGEVLGAVIALVGVALAFYILHRRWLDG